MKFIFLFFIGILTSFNSYGQTHSISSGNLIEIKMTEEVRFKRVRWGNIELQYLVKLKGNKAEVFRTYQTSDHPTLLENPLEDSDDTVLISKVNISIIDSLLHEVTDSCKHTLLLRNLQISPRDLKLHFREMTNRGIYISEMDKHQKQKFKTLVEDTVNVNKVLKHCVDEGIRYDSHHAFLKKIEFISKDDTLTLISESQGAFYLPWKIENAIVSYNRSISKYFDLIIPKNKLVSRSFYHESDFGLYQCIGEEVYKKEGDVIKSK